MKDSRSSAVWPLRLIGLTLIYAMLTLAVATAATRPADPSALFFNLHRPFSALAQAVPGTGLWPLVMDMHGMLGGGVFSTPMAGILMLALAGFGALGIARSIRNQQREDGRIARDEAIREQVRKSQRKS